MICTAKKHRRTFTKQLNNRVVLFFLLLTVIILDRNNYKLSFILLKKLVLIRLYMTTSHLLSHPLEDTHLAAALDSVLQSYIHHL